MWVVDEIPKLKCYEGLDYAILRDKVERQKEKREHKTTTECHFDTICRKSEYVLRAKDANKESLVLAKKIPFLGGLREIEMFA